jgi:hypothetical protein
MRFIVFGAGAVGAVGAVGAAGAVGGVVGARRHQALAVAV